MIRLRSRAALAFAAAGIAALPVAAGAHPAVSPASVAAHVAAADAGLDRAAVHFAAGRQAAGVKAMISSRTQQARARAEAAKLLRTAATPAQRVIAARALARVAVQYGAQVDSAVAALGPASAGAENRLSAGAVVDVKGRERALSTLQRLLPALPAAAQPGIGRAVAALSLDRSDAVEDAAAAAADEDVTPRAAARLGVVIDVNLRGQARATATLTALRDRLPAAARQGIDRALAAVGGDRQESADALGAHTGGMPPAVRSKVEGILGRALPAPTEVPAGPPAETPAGPPAEVPGPPAETPAGPPADIPAGPPSTIPSPVTPPAGPFAG